MSQIDTIQWDKPGKSLFSEIRSFKIVSFKFKIRIVAADWTPRGRAISRWSDSEIEEFESKRRVVVLPEVQIEPEVNEVIAPEPIAINEPELVDISDDEIEPQGEFEDEIQPLEFNAVNFPMAFVRRFEYPVKQGVTVKNKNTLCYENPEEMDLTRRWVRVPNYDSTPFIRP